MSLLVIPRNADTISALEIDMDKDWHGQGITNLKELASNMHKGDIFMHDGSGLVKLGPGNIGDELTSDGPGHLVGWKAPPAT
jgi:hypothetical protein